MKSTVLRISLLLALASGADARDVLVVRQSGGAPGAYTTIGAAVAAASDGDFVLVRAGDYPESVVIDGKSLRVHASPGAVVLVDGLSVRNVASDQSVVVGGLLVFADPVAPAVVLENNAGDVWLQSGRGHGAIATITNCAEVVVNGWDFDAGFFGSCISGFQCFEAGVRVENSRVSFFDCDILGPGGIECSGPEVGLPGILAIGSSVWVYASDVTGGRGAGDCGGAASPGAGGAGIELQASSELDSLGSTIRGGAGGTGFSGTGPAGTPFKIVSGTHRARGNTGRLLAYSSIARTGTVEPLDYQGKPDDIVFLLIALQPSSLGYLPNLLGPVLVPTNSVIARVGKADATGVFSTMLPVPNVASGVRTYYLQHAALNNTVGELVVGPPNTLHVLGPGY